MVGPGLEILADVIGTEERHTAKPAVHERRLYGLSQIRLVETVLELGSGGGNNASHTTAQARCRAS